MQFRWNGVSERDMDLFFLEEFALNEDHLRLVSLLCETAKQIDRGQLITFYAAAAPEKLK